MDLILPTIAIILLLVGGGYLGWRYMSGKTGSNQFRKIATVLLAVGLIWIMWVNWGVILETDDDNDDDGHDIDCYAGIVTDYEITAALDSTTYAFADFTNTDENGVTANEITIDNSAHTITNYALGDYSGSTLTYDVSSISFTALRTDPSKWCDGAKVTSSLGLKLSSDPGDWFIIANATIPDQEAYVLDRNVYGTPGLMITDGAGAATKLGATDIPSLNEFSSGESVTAVGVYMAYAETAMSRYVPLQTFTFHTTFTFYDDFGFDEPWSYTLTLTVQE